MLAGERQKFIYELLQNRRYVTASELSRQFDVSMETIRKDLLELERQNLILRVHGGAMLRSLSSGLPPFKERMVTNPDLKAKAASAAAEIVSNNDIIAIDSGATGVFLVEELKKRVKYLTILTSDIHIANAVEKVPDYELILAGGKCIKKHSLFTGDTAEYTISRIRPDHTFIIPSSVSLNGIGIRVYEYVSVVLAYIKAARSVNIVFESSKLGRDALYKVCDLSAGFQYITDDCADEGICSEYAERAGITIIKYNKNKD